MNEGYTEVLRAIASRTTEPTPEWRFSSRPCLWRMRASLAMMVAKANNAEQEKWADGHEYGTKAHRQF